LLGIPGLINAYKTATALALQTTPIVQKQIEVLYTIEFDYSRMNDVMLILKQSNCTVSKQEMQLFCSMQTGIPKSRIEEVLYKFKELHDVVLKQTIL
jgi:putative IMPACT (imprinted ancient) family translation regulator